MKPYQRLPIVECGEPLVPLAGAPFVLAEPHPYQKLGAPYGQISPFFVRAGVLQALHQAHDHLQRICPGWCLLIFDAYRPVAVQQFMVDYTLNEVLQARKLEPEALTPGQRRAILAEVYQIWAIPSPDPATPPPHSTGAAVDVTLVNASGARVDMGSAIDELSPRSQPDYFARMAADPTLDPMERERAAQSHHHRHLLWQAMTAAGFERHPGEWWHFCWGDQMWAWLRNQQSEQPLTARYGRVEP